MAEKTNASITSISSLVNETTRCFEDATSDTNQAEVLAQNALQLVNEAANVSRLSDWLVFCITQDVLKVEEINTFKLYSVAVM